MALPALSWLLRLAAVCHLTMLLAGQHHGVKKCSTSCSITKLEIPISRLISYQENQLSCSKSIVILKTVENRSICADRKAEWVQKAMEYLKRRVAAQTQNDSRFDRLVGPGEPRSTLAARGVDRSAVSEPKATGESSPQEVHGALGTSPELPTRVAGSWGPGSPAVSKAPDAGPPAGPERTELYDSAAVTGTTSWQSSAAYQPGSDLGAEGKASEAPSAQAPSTQAPSTPTLPTHATSTPTLPTQAPSTPTFPTQAPSTPTFPTQAPSTPTLPTQAPSTPTLPTQAPSTPTLPTQAPSTPTLPTQTPSTQAPTISRTTPGDNTGPAWTKGQNPMPENSIGPREMGPISAHTEALKGPSRTPHVSAVPVSSEGAPSRESVATGSPLSKEIIPSTMDSQSLGVISTPVPDSQAATRRQAVGLLAFLGLLFCLGMAMFAYQSLQGCPRKIAGDVVEGLRYVPRSCGSNSYVLVPV